MSVVGLAAVHLIYQVHDILGASQVVQWESLPANAGDEQEMNRRFDPWVGRSPAGGNGNPVQYSCLENAMDKEPGGLQSWGCKA